jgi:predicted  nucleic acid-binding Zn-ribbon protein
MKKAITIPKIEEQLYNRVKEEAEAKNQSISDYVSYLFSHADDIYSNKESLDELKEKIETKNITISEQANKIKDLENKVESNENFEKENNQLQQENYELSEKIKELEQKLKATEEENEQFLTVDPNKITVELDDLERLLIYFVCERESKREGEEITPCKLLRSMFVNYSLKGGFYFFKIPTRKELLELKKKLNTENNE